MKSRRVVLGFVILSLVTVFLVFCFYYLFRIKSDLPLVSQVIPQPQKTHYQTFALDVFENKQGPTPPFTMPKINQPVFPSIVCDITNYGAIGDGTTSATRAIAAAIDDCAQKGGGTVNIPTGHWQSGTITLKDNINLHLADNAIITFSTNPQDYLPAVFSRYEGVEYFGYAPLIYANHATNIAITGNGSLDGQGHIWWPRNNMKATLSLYQMAADNVPVKERIFDNEAKMLRPSFVEFVNSKNILLENFTIKNSPMWTIHPLYSSDIVIRNLNINTPGLNTDGIALDSVKNVLIQDTSIISGDDALVIKSGRDSDGLRVNRPSENIVVRNNNILEGHSGIALGSETSGNINNVLVYDNKIDRTNFGIRIKSSIGRGGTVDNVLFKDNYARRVDDTAILFTTDYDEPYSQADTAIPHFKNISIDAFKVDRATTALTLKGISTDPLDNLNLSNLEIISRKGIQISNVANSSFVNWKITVKQEPLFELKNIQNSIFDNTPCALKTDCLNIGGDQTSNITLKNSNLKEASINFENSQLKNSVTIQ